MEWCLRKLQNRSAVDFLGLHWRRRFEVHRQLSGREVEKACEPPPERPFSCPKLVLPRCADPAGGVGVTSEADLEASATSHADLKVGATSRSTGWLWQAIVLLGWLLSTVTAQGQKPTIASLPTLTHVEQIRRMSIEEAGWGYPVHLRAVVTYYNWDAGDLFIQDSTAGIWVNPGQTKLALHQGEFVEVEGISGVGDLAPEIEQAHFRSLGEAPMPDPQRPTSDQLASGRLDSQWIEIQGVVRSVAEREGGLVLNVSSGAFECSVFVLEHPSFPTDIVDGQVRIRGVFAGLYDPSSIRVIGFQVLTPSWSGVQVLERPTQRLWSAPVRPIRLFLRLTPEGAFTHRVRVRGVVTLQQLGQFLCIRDSEGALLVNTNQSTPLKVGDLIDAMGFPAIGDYTVIMRDAIFQRVAGGPAPEPVAVSPEELRAGSHNADLVRLAAQLLNCTTRPGEQVLELRAGQVTFRAVLNTGTKTSPLGSLRAGSLLQLTGVSMVEADKNHQAKGFELLLRFPADVVVLKLPSWWTVGRALLVLSLLAVAVILALGWIAALRRRVRRQTETIRLKYERELALEEQYRDLFENANDLIQCVSQQGRLLYVNPAWRKTLGYSQEEIANLSIYDIIHPNHLQDCRGLFQRLMSGEKVERIEVEFVANSRETVVCEGSCDCQSVGGRPVSIRAILRNVTERKRAEEARSFLACIVESSDYAIFGTSPDGTILSWNAAAEALFGYSPNEILGKHVSTLVPPERADEVPQVLELLRRGEGISHFETTPMRRDGTRLTVSLTVSPIKSTTGGVVGAATIAYDISERKRAEMELQKAKQDAEAANRAKSEFLANMSHEIRTPMNGVLGMTELALGTDLTSEQREYLEIVKASANSLLAIINDILDFSKIEAGKLELEVTPLRLRESLARIIKPLALRAQQKGLELVCDVRPEVPEEIVADPTRLAQVLCNLLGNAIKFTNQGEVELRTELSRQHADRLTLHFTVRDTGIGIPREKQKAIFEAFAQADGSTSRRFGGTGLGLTISTRLVEMMGGRIWVESHLGKGSRFHFTAQVGRVKSERTVKPAELAPLQGLSVLVADDNAASRRIVGELLESVGMKPVLAASESEALTLLEEAQTANTSFALMILDCHMAGMGGFELVEVIKQRPALAGIPIVMLTSAGVRGDVARCRELGIAVYISKPVNQAQLVDSVRATLGCQAPGETAPARIPHSTWRAGEPKLRVLLAEDNAVNQMLAVRLLQKQGHSAVVVGTGRAALEALNEREFDLVLMDVQMPDMDGFEATAAIREREKGNGKHVWIIAMTAHAMAGDQERCLAVGMDGYLAKPISGQALASEITRVRAASAAVQPEPVLEPVDLEVPGPEVREGKSLLSFSPHSR